MRACSGMSYLCICGGKVIGRPHFNFELGFGFLDPKNLYIVTYMTTINVFLACARACALTVARTSILSSDLDSLTQKTYILTYMTTGGWVVGGIPRTAYIQGMCNTKLQSV